MVCMATGRPALDAHPKPRIWRCPYGPMPPGEGVLDSIVKIYCVYSRSDWLLPWQAHPKREGTGEALRLLSLWWRRRWLLWVLVARDPVRTA